MGLGENPGANGGARGATHESVRDRTPLAASVPSAFATPRSDRFGGRPDEKRVGCRSQRQGGSSGGYRRDSDGVVEDPLDPVEYLAHVDRVLTDRELDRQRTPGPTDRRELSYVVPKRTRNRGNGREAPSDGDRIG